MMDTGDSVCNGLPMTVEQMREHRQTFCRSPVVLRKAGVTAVKCPCCGTIHDHGPQPGCHVPDCADDDNGAGILKLQTP